MSSFKKFAKALQPDIKMYHEPPEDLRQAWRAVAAAAERHNKTKLFHTALDELESMADRRVEDEEHFDLAAISDMLAAVLQPLVVNETEPNYRSSVVRLLQEWSEALLDDYEPPERSGPMSSEDLGEGESLQDAIVEQLLSEEGLEGPTFGILTVKVDGKDTYTSISESRASWTAAELAYHLESAWASWIVTESGSPIDADTPVVEMLEDGDKFRLVVAN